MESLYILIPLAILIISLAVGVFIWAVKSGQFEDLDAQGKRILFDDSPGLQKASRTKSASSESALSAHNSVEDKNDAS